MRVGVIKIIRTNSCWEGNDLTLCFGRYGRPIQPGIGLQLAPDQFLKSRGIEGALVVGVTSDEAKDIFRVSGSSEVSTLG